MAFVSTWVHRAGLLVALLFVLALAPAAPGLAVLPDEALDDPALEQRAREISTGLRCVVCQNQSIDDSAAPLARDLRLLVRERLKAGDTDGEVVAYIVARYGDFVLMRPPVQPNTILLWIGPALFVMIAVAAAAVYTRRRRAVPSAPLSAQERAALARLTDDKAEG